MHKLFYDTGGQFFDVGKRLLLNCYVAHLYHERACACYNNTYVCCPTMIRYVLWAVLFGVDILEFLRIWFG